MPGISEPGINDLKSSWKAGERNHLGLFEILIMCQVQECKMTSHKHSDKQSIDIFVEDFEFMKDGLLPECDCSSYATRVNELVRAYRYCSSHNISFPRDKHANIILENVKK